MVSAITHTAYACTVWRSESEHNPSGVSCKTINMNLANKKEIQLSWLCFVTLIFLMLLVQTGQTVKSIVIYTERNPH